MAKGLPLEPRFNSGTIHTQEEIDRVRKMRNQLD